ncbi:MAG TPA: hypothetical protein VFK06_09425 [Candidatus Angelobacter sp.]|nr:hypothetical protein [Candidatus Angelobacter sp.]
MARGWESKSVESQMDEAAGEKHSSAPVTDAEREKRRSRAALALNLAYLEQQLASASNERYRQSLEMALADMKQKLADLDGN